MIYWLNLPQSLDIISLIRLRIFMAMHFFSSELQRIAMKCDFQWLHARPCQQSLLSGYVDFVKNHCPNMQGCLPGEGGEPGHFVPGPTKGPFNTCCLKDRYTLIEQSGSRYSNRAVTVFFRGAVYQAYK